MRRQTQERGVKLWSGNDLLDLQHECLKICDSFLGQFGSGILSGCEVSGGGISKGLVFLDGKVIPFHGADRVSFPSYLKTKATNDSRYYEDGSYQPIAVEYEAELVTFMPAENCITINATGNQTFFELLQNDSRLFFTKAERDKLAAIEAQANKIIVDSALDRSSTNPLENRVIVEELNKKADAGHTHNYLPLSGGTLTGKLTVPSSNASNVEGGAIEIREYGNVSTSQSGWYYSPSITFNWYNVHTKRLGLRYDGDLAIDDKALLHAGNYTSYVNTKQEVTEAINAKTTAAEIYGKQIPSSFTAAANPTDIVVGDTLQNGIQKAQGYINKFKRSTGIQVATDFTPASTYSAIAANDTVDTALRKTQKFMNDVNGTSLPDLLSKTPFDYVVSDSQSLYNLRNNPNARCVLIKSGTIVYDTDVFPYTLNLHENTKMLVAEPGSVIQLTGTSSISYFIAHAEDSVNGGTLWGDYDVSFHNLEITSTENFEGKPFGAFYRTKNCYNCRIIDDYGKLGNSFAFVDNLVNCYVRTSGFYYYNCNKLVNCRAEPGKYLLDQKGHNGYYMCMQLSNCEADYSTLTNPASGETDSTSCFYQCRFLTGCIGRITGYAPLFVFYTCWHLTSCGAYYQVLGITTTYNDDLKSGMGYRYCDNAVNCYAIFSGSIPSNGYAYGFANGYSLGFNKSVGEPTDHFYYCSPNRTDQGTAGSTAAGGFNTSSSY